MFFFNYYFVLSLVFKIEFERCLIYCRCDCHWYWDSDNFSTVAVPEEEPAGPTIQLAMWVCIISFHYLKFSFILICSVLYILFIVNWAAFCVWLFLYYESIVYWVRILPLAASEFWTMDLILHSFLWENEVLFELKLIGSYKKYCFWVIIFLL